MNLIKRLFAPTVTLQSVHRLAEAAGVIDFSELLRKAEAAGLLDQRQAAALREKAKTDEAAAEKALEAAIAAANAAYEASLRQVDQTDVEADQRQASAKETLTAVKEFKDAMGK